MNLLNPICDLRNLNKYLSKINLIVKGTGSFYFLNKDFYTEPSEVIVNDIQEISCKKGCYFKK